MQLIEIIFISFTLSIDAFAVAIATGASLKEISPRQNFRLAWHFGLFQAMMPILGWYAGTFIHGWIEAYDHWAAFILLVLVAQGMLRNAFKEKKDENIRKDPTRGLTLIMLSIATSIDALAIGLSLAMLKVSIWFPALIIGIVTGLITAAGMRLGKYIGGINTFGRYAEGTGGIILLFIGFRILYEHGVFTIPY